MIRTLALNLLGRDLVIESIQQIINYIKEMKGIEVKGREVSDVIKGDLNMSFRKLKKISLHGNSNKNLILRQ